MKKLKFRIWDKEKRKYVTSVYDENFNLFYPSIDLNGYLSFERQTEYGVEDYEYVDGRFVIEQYTGFCDKNDVGIYEGDIIKLCNWNDEFYEVIYDDYHDFGTPAFVLEGNGGYGDWFSNKDREVIGNIHENSELVK